MTVNSSLSTVGRRTGSGDTDSFDDIFVRDLVNNTTTLVSVSTAGSKSNSYSYQPSISGDGRYVAFRSGATNLDPGDTDGISDIFVRDLVNNTTTLVSTSSSGVKSNSGSSDPSISDDGRYVAFSSYANNLANGDTNSSVDIFVKDLQTGDTTLVSNTLGGGQAAGYYFVYRPSISAMEATWHSPPTDYWEVMKDIRSTCRSDNASPTIDDVTLNPIEENSGEGTVVGQVVASDPDGDALTYTIGDSRFEVDSNGNITVAAVQRLTMKLRPASRPRCWSAMESRTPLSRKLRLTC